MSKDQPVTINLRLIKERQDRHWSQQEVANRLGTTRNTISRWERGIIFPDPHFRQLLCSLFGKSAEDLALVSHKVKSSTLWEPSETSLSPNPGGEEQGTHDAVDPCKSQVTYRYVPLQRNPFFTGRESILQMLHHVLTEQHIPAALTQSYALHGLGGVGKTQIALEYTYRYAPQYTAIFWLRAETSETLLVDFVAIARVLDLPEQGEPDQQRIVQAVLHWLSSQSNWLLVFDNVEDFHLLARSLPSAPQGPVLLTTRLHALGSFAQQIPVEPMEQAEGITFLLHRARLLQLDLPADQFSFATLTAIREISEAMDGLPLALEQAGAYLEATRCHPANYLQMLRSSPLRLLDEHESHASHPLSVTKTFSLTFEQMERNHPAAVEVLTVCAFLAPEAIPETFFREGAEELGPTFVTLAADPFAFQAALKALLNYSLVQRHSEEQTLIIHRLVQIVLKERLPATVQQTWVERVIRALNKIFPANKMSVNYWQVCEQLLPHALLCLTLSEQWGEEIEEHPIMMYKVANYFVNRSRLAEAEILYQRVLQINQQRHGSEHLSILSVLNRLANTAFVQEDYQEAEQLCLRVLRINEQTLAPDDLQIANSLNNLGILSVYQGKYQEAEQYYQRALDIREHKLGLEHPLSTSLLNNLAVLYLEQGKYDKAEYHMQRALCVNERILGPEHTQLVLLLINLGKISLERGNYEQTMLSCQRAIHILEKAMGSKNPEFIFPFLLMGHLFFKRQEYQHAEVSYQHALDSTEHLGESYHPTTVAQVLAGQANLSHVQGKYSQAEALYQRSLMLFRKYGVPKSPYTAESLHDMACFYQEQGQVEKARTFYQEALAIREQVLGFDHPKTKATRVAYTQLLSEGVSF
jgi:tetratricopeptide (TPR) repeat protein/transcriptional regulator with XRE-family HTH domain